MTGAKITNPAWAAELEPDLAGPHGRAWRGRTADGLEDEPKAQTTVATWIMHVPGAHPFWTWWALACVTLRPIEGVAAAHKRSPDAEYELMVLALDPRELPPHPHRIGADRVYHLEPVDFVGQFPALPGGDDQARELVELFAKACVNGVLSPDQDWRARWQESLDATVDHYVRGIH